MEAWVARGFYLVVVPIRSHKPTGRGTVSGKTGRGKGGRGSTDSGRSSDSLGRGRMEKGRGRSGARDGPLSSQVCFKCGSPDHWARDCPKMHDGSSNPKKRNLGAYAYGSWTCSNTNSSLDETCVHFSCDASNHLDDSICVDLVCGATMSPDQDDDECEAHAAFLIESEVFGVLDCGATTFLVALKVQRLCSPILMKMTHEFQMLIRLVVDRSVWEMVLRQKLHPCPDSQFDALGDFWIPLHPQEPHNNHTTQQPHNT